MKSGGKTKIWCMPSMSPFWPIYKSRRKIIHSVSYNISSKNSSNYKKSKSNKMIWCSTVLCLILLQSSVCECQNIQSEKSDNKRRGEFHVQGGNNLAFTQESYNVVIPENSLGKVYAVPSDLNTKMGISLENSGIENYENLNIRFRIRSGDTDDFFKAEAEKIGDFVFLLIRTKTNNIDVLNRERQDFYELEIKTRVRDKENRRIGKSNAEASTIVRVKVKDVNDLDPFFQPSSYAFTVAEDTPLHQVGKIIIM